MRTALIGITAAALIMASPAAPAAASSCTPMQLAGIGPCKPFQNRARTLQYVRTTLLANGFYSAGLQLTVASPQKITYRGTQDGVRTWGEVFKTGDRQLWVSFGWIDPDLGRSVGRSHTFKTGFVA